MIRDHARDVGAGGWLEISVPAGTSDRALRALDDAFTRERARGCAVRVSARAYEVSPRANEHAAAADPDPNAAASGGGPPEEEALLPGLMQRVGRVLHEAQRERDYATVHAASAGRLFEIERRHQHDATDEAARALRGFVESRADRLPRAVALCAEVALEALAHLPEARERTAAAGTGTAALDAYARLVASLLAVAHVVAASEEDGELARMALAHAAFLNAKEQADRERAEIASGWAVEGYAPDPFSVESLIAARNAFLKIFEIAASPAVLDAFRRRVATPEWQDVAEMEDLARSRIRPAAAPASAARWFERMTTRLERLREVEDLQLEQMLRRATLTKPQ